MCMFCLLRFRVFFPLLTAKIINSFLPITLELFLFESLIKNVQFGISQCQMQLKLLKKKNVIVDVENRPFFRGCERVKRF